MKIFLTAIIVGICPELGVVCSGCIPVSVRSASRCGGVAGGHSSGLGDLQGMHWQFCKVRRGPLCKVRSGSSARYHHRLAQSNHYHPPSHIAL
jgi:hypothetical protein